MALTKTTTIDLIDEWASVGSGMMREGAAKSIADSYSSLLYIDLANTSTNAQSGVTITVEVSYGDVDWTPLLSFKSNATGAETSTLSAEVTVGSTNIFVTAVSSMATIGRRWFVLDGTDSEIVTTKSDKTGGQLGLTNGVKATHANTTPVYSLAESWVITLPDAASQVRVLYNNLDVDSSVFTTSRVSKITSVTA